MLGLLNESAVHPHSPEERASHFHAWSGGTTEVEYRRLVVALADCLKPRRALETGIFHPVGIPALAAVCERLDLVDTDQRWCVAATALGLTNVRVHQDSGQHWIEHGFQGKPFDFAFLDSALDRRCGELEALLEKQRLAPGAVVAIHDTSRVRVMGGGRCPESLQFWDAFEALRKKWRLEVVELPLSRGMLLVQRAR